MDREGVPRSEPVRLANERHWSDPRCKPNERGWIEPFSHVHGWAEFNFAAYALQCVLIWSRGAEPPLPAVIADANSGLNRGQLHQWSAKARIESDMRSFNFALARSRCCDRPRLPT
jgi:hypothetical protein